MFNNDPSNRPIINPMHETMKRLYAAAEQLKGVSGQSNVARLLRQSPQTLNNWERRGMSMGGMLAAQRVIGCSAVWLETGHGEISPPCAERRRVWVIGNDERGILDELMPGHGDLHAGATHQYAEEQTDDAEAFIVRIEGGSMVPRYMPGEYVMVEPSVTPELEDDVLVHLASGETMVRRLLSRRGGIRLGTYSGEVTTIDEREVSWMYIVSTRLPEWKIRRWIESSDYIGEDRRREGGERAVTDRRHAKQKV